MKESSRSKSLGLSIIVPIYNERDTIEKTIADLEKAMVDAGTD